MKIMLDSEIPSHSVPGLHNYNKSVVLGLYQALLHLGLGCAPGTHLAFPQRLGPEAAFLPAPCMQVFCPSLIHNFDNCTHHDPQIDKICRRVVAMYVRIFAANGNCLLYVS